MELIINKRLFDENGNQETSVLEPVVRIPYVEGVHATQIGKVELIVGRFDCRSGTEKVVIFSEALHTKKSDSRRVVEFSQRYERVVAQDISPTARYEFSRQG